jgi:hypothetical protein
MFNDFKIILDPPPHGVYTFEDTVSGKVILESSHEEKIGWVYVFFHGWVNVEIVMLQTPTYAGAHNNPQKWSDKTKDKEILFQNHVKVYEGYEKLRKKMRYEWPFKFSFQAETSNAASLPTSGHYSFSTESNWWSSVQYPFSCGQLCTSRRPFLLTSNLYKFQHNKNKLKYSYSLSNNPLYYKLIKFISISIKVWTINKS